MNPKHEIFIKDLVKGKIAEIIFEQMFRESGRYTILHSSYKNTHNEHAQYHQLVEINAVNKNISNAQDFDLVSQDKREIYLEEVKYRTRRNQEDLKKVCEDTL